MQGIGGSKGPIRPKREEQLLGLPVEVAVELHEQD